MPSEDPIQARLRKIVVLINEGGMLAASRAVDDLDRELIAGGEQVFDLDRNVALSNLLDRVSTALATHDTQGALILLEQALTVWARGRTKATH
jgi:hypothetical protein